MPQVTKPIFNKTASYLGSNQSYNCAVWEDARIVRAYCGDAIPDGDTLRAVRPDVSKDHVVTALEYLRNAP